MPANSIDDRKTCAGAAAAGEQPLQPGIDIGAQLLARGREMRLDAITPHDDCCELHLQELTGRERRVLLWPFDRPRVIRRERRLRPVRLGPFLRRMHDLASSELDALTPRAPGADVAILPYQIVPAAAVASGVHRILLADEVGLGKTIQAGWIVGDLLAREPWSRALIAVPAAVRSQWTTELLLRFGLHAREVDARWMRSAIADLPVDVNPWTPPGIYVVSHDFLKRTDVAAAAAASTWDLLIVDEAHTAAAPTDRYGALAAVAAVARRVVCITATPYSGDAPAFQSMVSLGARRGAGESPPAIFRRRREDAGDERRRRHRFVAVRLTRAETRLQRMLERYSRLVWRDESSAGDGRLAMTILRKRALSSPVAAARSLARRLDLLSSREPIPVQRSLFDDEPIDDEVSAAILGAPGLEDAALEVRTLRSLVDAAGAASAGDSKLRFLARLLRRARGESAVVFTEYRDTLQYLATALHPTLLLHGGMSASERASVQCRFNSDGGLLLATDAAAEGLNLQGRCRLIVNYELPWNPGRLEQRIGRVDRIGQRRVVHAISLLARHTAEDLVVANVVKRMNRVADALGSSDPLAALLDAAAVARLVIGGEDPRPEPPSVASAGEAFAFCEPDVSIETAYRIALQIGQPSRGVRRATVVASIRAGRIPAGYSTAFECVAITSDGDIVARTHRVLHLAARPARPRTAAAVREQAVLALDLLSRAGGISALDHSVNGWFSAVQSTHEATIDRQVHREQALRLAPGPRTLVQPGLFDRRAVAAADEQSRLRDDIDAEHERRLATLQRRRALSLVCDPIGVLVAWR